MKNYFLFFVYFFLFQNVYSHNKKYILTGGPGCGKTTVLNELAQKGYQTCPEAYSELYKEFKAKNELDRFLPCTIEQRWLLMKKHEEQEALLDQDRIAFVDRSVPDVIFYGNYLRLDMPGDLLQIFENHKSEYVKVFFFEQPSQELYEQNEVRYETFEEAVNIHNQLLYGYRSNGFEIIHVPFDSVKTRVNYILSHIN